MATQVTVQITEKELAIIADDSMWRAIDYIKMHKLEKKLDHTLIIKQFLLLPMISYRDIFDYIKELKLAKKINHLELVKCQLENFETCGGISNVFYYIRKFKIKKEVEPLIKQYYIHELFSNGPDHESVRYLARRLKITEKESI